MTSDSNSIAIAMKARAKWHRVVELADFLGHDEEPIGKVAIVINSKRDDIAAQREAHAEFDRLAKEGSLGRDTFKDDAHILDDLKNVFAIFKAFRKVDNLDAPAFVAAEWVVENFDNAQLGTLVRLYNQSQAMKGPTPWEITPEWIRTIRDACRAYDDQNEPAQQPLAAFSREYVDDFLSAAMVLWSRDQERLVAENEKLREELAAHEATIGALVDRGVICDGNHSHGPCDDPECWHLAKEDQSDESPLTTEEPSADAGEPSA